MKPRKHYYTTFLQGEDGKKLYIAPCGFNSHDAERLTLNEKFVTCISCKRYANKVPADALGPISKLAREK